MKQIKEIKKPSDSIITLKEAMSITSNTPTMDFLWWGIPNAASVTLIAARAKVGKTIFAENLSIALIDDLCKDFLGLPIKTVSSVAIISFEEHLNNRTQRQAKQLEAYLTINNTTTPIDERLFVLDANFYQFLADEKQRSELYTMLEKLKPEVVIIDSLGRLAIGQIENSDFAQKIMLYLRELAFNLGIPVIVLHHTVKSKKGDAVELSSMAGSRIVGQEADAVFTIIDGHNSGEKVIKPLAFRYSGSDDADITFRIDEDCLLDHIGSSKFSTTEKKLSKEVVLENYFIQNCTATSTELENYVKENKLMGRSTLFEVLKKLPIQNMGNGNYKYNLCTTAVALENSVQAVGTGLINLNK